MDHADLFDIARTQELASLAAADTGIPAPIRAQLSDAVGSLTRAFNMVDATVGGDLTDAQRGELTALRIHLRDNYQSGIKGRTRDRFSDAGAKRGQRKRAEIASREVPEGRR